jgi:indole-3-glycerol phosphate synthase
MILDDIVLKTKERYKGKLDKIDEIKALSEKRAILNPNFFYEAIEKKGISFICEVKKASPSKGLIAPDFPYTEIAKDYEEAGASCISILTEPEYFMGDIEYLKEIRREVNIPLLRKDFTIDPYMIYEAKASGADAILLIAAILTDEELKEYKGIADELGISCIFEVSIVIQIII